MGRADYWLAGSWNFICDQCGEKFKASQAIKEWDNLVVCRQCWDPRHPQDFIRAVPERTIPWARPDNSPCIPPTPPTVITPRFIDFPFPIDGTFIG